MKHGHKVELDDSISMFVGLDVYKNYLQAAVVDDEGTLLKEERKPNQVAEIEKFFADVDDAKIWSTLKEVRKWTGRRRIASSTKL
nr:hypothetical protein [Candidatus Njordarchaeum guaymaensis]